MSEPTLARPARRRLAANPQCAICSEATRNPVAFGMVRPSLATGIKLPRIPIQRPRIWICRTHLTELAAHVMSSNYWRASEVSLRN